ncbi:hypothetical protein [Adhaeribacter aerolatus]|nr:hypothetical protein [Adhaeribacter aerolatus]
MKKRVIVIGIFIFLLLTVIILFLGSLNNKGDYAVGDYDPGTDTSTDTVGMGYGVDTAGIVFGPNPQYPVNSDTTSAKPRPNIPKEHPRFPIKADTISKPIDAESAQAAVGNLLKGNMAYYVPDSMLVNQPRRVSLTVSRNMALKALEKSIEKSIAHEPDADTSRIVSERINISKVMTANLYAMDSTKFQIRRISEKEQYVHLAETDTTQTKWEWSVKPLAAGDHEIIIKVSALIKDGQKERPIEFEVYNGVVPVMAVPPTPGEKVSNVLSVTFNFVKENWEWIAGFVTALAGLVGWLKSRFGKQQPKQDQDKEQPKVIS